MCPAFDKISRVKAKCVREQGLTLLKENRRTKNANATVATAVGYIGVLPTKNRSFAMRQDFAIQCGLNGVYLEMDRICNN